MQGVQLLKVCKEQVFTSCKIVLMQWTGAFHLSGPELKIQFRLQVSGLIWASISLYYILEHNTLGFTLKSSLGVNRSDHVLLCKKPPQMVKVNQKTLSHYPLHGCYLEEATLWVFQDHWRMLMDFWGWLGYHAHTDSNFPRSYPSPTAAHILQECVHLHTRITTLWPQGRLEGEH